MQKLTFCLVRLPHLTREAFQDYWFNTHGPLVRSVAGLLGIKRYVQLHSADPAASAAIVASRGGPPQFDGVAELWIEPRSDLTPAQREEAASAGRLLLEDEKRFIDLSRSPLWFGEEKVIIG